MYTVLPRRPPGRHALLGHCGTKIVHRWMNQGHPTSKLQLLTNLRKVPVREELAPLPCCKEHCSSGSKTIMFHPMSVCWQGAYAYRPTYHALHFPRAGQCTGSCITPGQNWSRLTAIVQMVLCTHSQCLPKRRTIRVLAKHTSWPSHPGPFRVPRLRFFCSIAHAL
jgi:hypothetical protein